jgi:hypothetical protein
VVDGLGHGHDFLRAVAPTVIPASMPSFFAWARISAERSQVMYWPVFVGPVVPGVEGIAALGDLRIVPPQGRMPMAFRLCLRMADLTAARIMALRPGGVAASGTDANVANAATLTSEAAVQTCTKLKDGY